MNKPQYFIGIDIASATFTRAVGSMGEKWQIVMKPVQFANEYDSFSKYLKWLHENDVKPENMDSVPLHQFFLSPIRRS